MKVIELLREGPRSAHIFCDPEESRDGRFWLIVDKNRLFARCSKDEATKLAQALSETLATKGKDDAPDFVLPFTVGDSWGADSESPSREDGFYQWNVDGKETTVLHGRLHSCYTLSYRTLPDDEERRICAGIGIISDEYNHHGTLDEYSIELVSFVSAKPKR